MAVVIPLKLVYTPVDDTVTAIRNYQVPSTEPSSIPYRTHPACAKRAAYPDPPPVIPVPDTGVAEVTHLPSPLSFVRKLKSGTFNLFETGPIETLRKRKNVVLRNLHVSFQGVKETSTEI